MAVLATFGVCAGGLMFAGAPALAALPETPETKPASPITATSETLHGVLNPGKAGEPGSYQFFYAPSETGECNNAFRAPESPALALGAKEEAESVTVTGLEPSREYAFCLVAYSLSAEPSPGLAVSFKTLPEAPTVELERASGTTSKAVSLEAVVNPNNQETPTFSFQYATEATVETLEGTVVTVNGEYPLGAGFGGQWANAPRIERLTPGTTYFYRVVAENAAHEKTEGKVESFSTVATPKTKPVITFGASTATFNGELSPLNATVASEYSFDYGLGAENCTGGAEGSPTTTESAGTGSGVKAVSASASGLQPNATYSVCLVSSNVFGAEVDPTTPQVEFHTLAAPPGVQGEATPVKTPFEATLEALLNPNNQETTYSFQYSTTQAAGKLTGTITTLLGASPLSGFGYQTASVATGHVLTPATTYYYLVIAQNTAHEKTEGKVEEFTTLTADAPIVEGESVTTITSKDAKLEAQVNPNYQATTYTFEYSTQATGEVLEGTIVKVPGGSIPAGFGAQPAGPVDLSRALAPETPYFYRVVATNAAGTTDGKVETFTTLIVPVPATGAAQNVTRTSATLSGTVNPMGSETSYHYAYADQEAYERALAQSLPNPYIYGRSTAEAPIGSGSSPQATEPLEVGGLRSGTVYHYAVIATNVLGITVVGPDETFTTLSTPPVLGGVTVSGVTQSSAMIATTLDARGLPTRYELQYGSTPGELELRVAGNATGPGAQPLTLNVGPLAPGTVYYYKLLAVNSDGTVETAEGTFTTLAAPPAPGSLAFSPAIPLLSIPSNAFAPEKSGKATTKTLSRAQKLKNALKACKRKPKSKRAACIKQARKRYGPAKKKK
jgi:hypothetical protein